MSCVKGTTMKIVQSGNETKRGVCALEPVLPSEVCTEDGATLGTVTEVWALTPNGLLPRSRSLLADYGPISGTAELFRTTQGFVEVTRCTAPFLKETRRINLSDIVCIDGDKITVSVLARDADGGADVSSSRLTRAVA